MIRQLSACASIGILSLFASLPSAPAQDPGAKIADLVAQPNGPAIREGNRPDGAVHSLNLMHRDINDVDMKYIAQIKTLFGLSVNQTSVGDAGVKELAGHKKLAHLDLFATRVTDAGMASLADLPLLGLTLKNTRVTDAGLKHLRA